MDYNQIATKAILPTVKQYTRKAAPITERLITLMALFERSDGNGEVNIHYNNYIYTLESFFDKSGGIDDWLVLTNNQYIVGSQSKAYKAGKKLIYLIDKVIASVYASPLPEVEVSADDILLQKHIFYGLNKQVNNSGFSKFRIPLLLRQIKGQAGDAIVFTNHHKQRSLCLRNVGRDYNTFSLLPSKLRKYTDTPFETDLDTAVQSIMLNTVFNIYKVYQEESVLGFTPYKVEEYQRSNLFYYKKLRKDFKVTYTLIRDKQKIREAVKKELQLPTVDDAKQRITKLFYGGYAKNDRDINRSYTLRQLFTESRRLISIISRYIKTLDDRLPIKRFVTERFNEAKAAGKKPSYRSKISYFIEYQESLIRNEMVGFAKMKGLRVKEVHDAIYTDKPIDKKELKMYIYHRTGMDILAGVKTDYQQSKKDAYI